MLKACARMLPSPSPLNSPWSTTHTSVCMYVRRSFFYAPLTATMKLWKSFFLSSLARSFHLWKLRENCALETRVSPGFAETSGWVNDASKSSLPFVNESTSFNFCHREKWTVLLHNKLYLPLERLLRKSNRKLLRIVFPNLRPKITVISSAKYPMTLLNSLRGSRVSFFFSSTHKSRGTSNISMARWRNFTDLKIIFELASSPWAP